jgi:hypothetical protein
MEDHLLRFPRQECGSSHSGEDLIRRSDALMPTDRSTPFVTGSVSLSGRVNTSTTSVVCPAPPKNVSSMAGPPGNCVFGRTMIATCANPARNVHFRYFRSGKIFMLEASDVDPRWRTDPPKRRIEYFWLCGECAPAMHLMRTTDGAVAICESPRSSDPLGPLRIAFALEVTSPGSKHRRFSGISI